MCLSFCLVVVSLVCPKETKSKQKRKLREEIKSSFLSGNSQLISNSTNAKHTAQRLRLHVSQVRIRERVVYVLNRNISTHMYVHACGMNSASHLL